MEKRKNEPARDYRPIIFAVVLAISAALIFLFLWLFPEVWCKCVADDFHFEETDQAIEATNNAVTTAIAQTEAASTLDAIIATNQAVVTLIAQTYAAAAAHVTGTAAP